MVAGQRGEEELDQPDASNDPFTARTHALLRAHRSDNGEASRWLRGILVQACLRPDHMWRDLGLDGRGDVTDLLTRRFPTLAAGNVFAWRWKKYLAYAAAEVARAGMPRLRGPLALPSLRTPPRHPSPSCPMSHASEAVGTKFSLAAMLHARTQSNEAVRHIAAEIRPGMTEQQARDHAKTILNQMGMQRIWHPVIIRFGEATLKKYNERSEPDRVLGEQDIFFVDIGPVWDGHEGDAGDTFVIGDDPEMHACAKAARVLWHEVEAEWRKGRLTGQELYSFADQMANVAGWRLNLDIKGHRVSDFPHAIYKAGDLGDFAACPATGLWILEIQIAHPTRPFGAFYEDLLAKDVA